MVANGVLAEVLLELLSLAALLVGTLDPLETDLPACCSLASRDLHRSGTDGGMERGDTRTVRNAT